MRVVPTSVALAVAFLLTTLSTALASEWVVRKANQPARYSTDGVIWTPLAAGMVVPEGSTVFTGPRGRVLLGRDAETILFTPNTLAAVARPGRSGFVTEIIQKFGRLVLEVETRDRPRARVRTPFLAAVVKGTRFEVSVGRQSALVKVRNGVVQVTELDGGARSDVRARQTATVSTAFGEPLRVSGPGPKAPLTRVEPVRPVVEPLTVERGRAVSKPSGRRPRSLPAVTGPGKTQRPDMVVPSKELGGGTDGGDGGHGTNTGGATGVDGAVGGGADGGEVGDGTGGGDGTGADGQDGAVGGGAGAADGGDGGSGGTDGGEVRDGSDGDDGGDGAGGGTGGVDGGGTDTGGEGGGGTDGGEDGTDGGDEGGGDGGPGAEGGDDGGGTEGGTSTDDGDGGSDGGGGGGTDGETGAGGGDDRGGTGGGSEEGTGTGGGGDGGGGGAGAGADDGAERGESGGTAE
jgi:hypothetical protein